MKLLKKITKNVSIVDIIQWLFIALVVLFLVNTGITTSLTLDAQSKVNAAVEAARPARIQVFTIPAPNCQDCFDIAKEIKALNEKNVNITEEKTLALTQAKEVIAQYKITKLPAVLVKGQVEKLSLEWTKQKDAFVFVPGLPYYDITLDKIKGRVALTVINPENCLACKDLTSFVASVKKLLSVSSTKIVNQADAKDLIQKYNLKTLPTVIISKDAQEYPDFTKRWQDLGTQEADGSFVLRELAPPYKEIETNTIKGLTMLTYITDKSCAGCYNVSVHKDIMQNRLGVYIERENTMDIESGEGKAYLFKYNITKVPTFFISSQIKDYPALKSVLSEVGTFEADGSFVFRNFDVIGVPYKDLNTGKLVEPPKK
ncbi:hypothetical protein HZB00_02060 [Candidatus Woesearchaeota archaeon]|nr:hypothetical protein [Candidatus Woesearchaeota archaeon]